MNESTAICQSCAMPLTDEVLGTERDGSKNQDYCHYCYKDGAFTGEQTMEEHIETCVPFVSNGDPWPDADTARAEMHKLFPTLKRWKDEAK